MEPVIRIAAAAVTATLAALLIRRTNPELAALLSIGTVLVLLFFSLQLGGALTELRALLRDDFSLSESYTRPLLKCVAAAVITKLTADLCRDSAQTAAASAVELAGTLCILGIITPLLISALRMVGAYL
jgi:stage III sporulation protein AD